MARKNPFASVMDEATPSSAPPVQYTMRGASKSFSGAIGEIAAQAKKLTEGETVVELDTATVDASFVQDRLSADDDEFRELVEAIRERGQDSPILVRPHPSKPGCYQVVFGHRRLRAASMLGRPVRAVVKELRDRDHVIAQGQENSARANLSFIERALFAGNLAKLNYDKDSATILAALSVDRPNLSKLLSVASLPPDVLRAIGPAKSIGRDRWYEMKILLENPSNLAAAQELLGREGFDQMASDERFHTLVAGIKAAKPRSRAEPSTQNWTPKDGALSAVMSKDGKRFTLALKAKGKDAQAFGEYLSGCLDTLYEAFRQETAEH